MATQKLLILKPLFDFIDEASSSDSVYRAMLNFGSCLWVLLCNFFLGVFGHFIERSKLDHGHENYSDTAALLHEREDQTVRISSGCEEEEKSEFTFGFRFQVREEDLINYKGVVEEKTEKAEDTGDSVFTENGVKTMTMSTSKYQLTSVKDFGGYEEEPKSVCFSVQELFVTKGSNEDDVMNNYGRKSPNLYFEEVQQEVKFEELVKELNEDANVPSAGKLDDFKGTEYSSGEILLQRAKLSGDEDVVSDEEKTEDCVKDASCRDEEDGLGKNGVPKAEQVDWLGEFLLRNDSFSYGNEFSQENESFPDDPKLVSRDSGDGYFSISLQNVDSASNGEREYEIPTANLESKEEYQSSELMDDDYIELEPQKQWNSDSNKEHELDSNLYNSMESENEPRKAWEYDLDEEDDSDVLLEHQELIDQMKMELKNARTGGLPTILEELESPRIKEDLKPLKIDEKLEHRDRMSEIQKFYKSYAEKMRKLDVLNYQTLQAINVMRMKHPDQLNTGENASLSAIKSVLMPNFWPCKLRRIYADPTLISITELQRDLELVYVGQTCLSWEILHWQYKKAKELQQHDPQGYRSYNQVAIEFQQFLVLLQRFTEDETFQGPRVQNYANQRCLLRGLLQVPAIKDDTSKEKKARSEEDGDAVSIATLANMIKESMRVFWEFLRSDKDTTNLILSKVLQGSKAYLQDPADSELLMDIKTSHQKKEKRLKDLLRTGNCIVKKFQKHNGETVLDQHMFVSQVELRLVSRVLSLPRLSKDQLVWCQTKLNNVNFIERKIRVEETLFLLFPC